MTILADADAIVAERAEDYGDVNVSFSRIAKLWSAYLNWDVKPNDVANMMILLKLSRLKHKYTQDSLRDVIGYAICSERLLG